LGFWNLRPTQPLQSLVTRSYIIVIGLHHQRVDGIGI
jgi:hypothetical protein